MSDPGAPHRAGSVAIVGRPNVGKSTLLNRLVGCKLSITSSKPQTTRQPLSGIATRPGAQAVFVDTPGYQTEHRSELHRAMNRSVAAISQEADVVLWVIEALAYDDRDATLAKLLPRATPVVVAINKSDRVKDRLQLLPFMGELARRRDFAAIVPVSATRGTQVEHLLEAIVSLLPEGPPLFGPDEITTANERFLAAELLREKLFRRLGDELPYRASVEIEQFRLEGKLRRIRAAIRVEREGHKAIVIGTRGAKLKEIATRARLDMERLFGGKVFLEVWVKVGRVTLGPGAAGDPGFSR